MLFGLRAVERRRANTSIEPRDYSRKFRIWFSGRQRSLVFRSGKCRLCSAPRPAVAEAPAPSPISKGFLSLRLRVPCSFRHPRFPFVSSTVELILLECHHKLSGNLTLIPLFSLLATVVGVGLMLLFCPPGSRRSY